MTVPKQADENQVLSAVWREHRAVTPPSLESKLATVKALIGSDSDLTFRHAGGLIEACAEAHLLKIQAVLASRGIRTIDKNIIFHAVIDAKSYVSVGVSSG